jgi:hypothetical protein
MKLVRERCASRARVGQLPSRLLRGTLAETATAWLSIAMQVSASARVHVAV